MKIINLFKVVLLVFLLYSFSAVKSIPPTTLTHVLYNLRGYNEAVIDESKLTSAQKEMDEQVKDAEKKMEFELVFNDSISVYKIVEKLSEADNHIYFTLSLMNGGGFIYYKNIKNKQKLYHAEFIGQKFNVSVPYEQYKWEITNETKLINGFKCYKATTTTEIIDKGKNTRKIYHPIVWFTPDIPTSFGPSGLDGLPGLVLEGTINGFSYFYATKITSEKTQDSNFTVLPKGKNITEDEFQDIVAQEYLDIKNNRK